MQEVKLPIEKLKEFLSYSSNIESDKGDFLPILQYIRIHITFGVCYLTKVNFSSFVRYQFEFSDDEMEIDFLVLESRLVKICSDSTKKELSIKIDGYTLNVTDGYLKQKWNNGSYDITTWISLPDESGDYLRLEKHIITALSHAKTYTSNDNVAVQFSPVYIKDKNIYASDRQKMYCKWFTDNLPDVAMSKKECDIVNKFDYIDYSFIGNYNTYKNKNILYGFRIQENATGFPYEQIKNSITKDNYIEINTEDLLSFCISTINFPEKIDLTMTATCIIEGTVAEFLYEDHERDEENRVEINISIIGDGFDFKFNPHQLRDILKNYPHKTICLSNEANMIAIWNPIEPNFVGMMMKFITN